jgi:hypothetical protein
MSIAVVFIVLALICFVLAIVPISAINPAQPGWLGLAFYMISLLIGK